VGGEKGEDEADTVGCCSLRVEHFTDNDDPDKVTPQDLLVLLFWSQN
jgi:DNA topoisomerase-1